MPVDHPDLRWLVVGWGARAFYTTAGSYADVKPGAVFKAVTGDSSVMRIDAAGALPETVPLRRLSLSPAQLAALLQAIDDSFQRDSQGAPISVDAQLGETDAFYQGTGRFHLFTTCNTWISATLRRAGLRFGAWTPAPFSVSLSHWLWQSRG